MVLIKKLYMCFVSDILDKVYPPTALWTNDLVRPSVYGRSHRFLFTTCSTAPTWTNDTLRRRTSPRWSSTTRSSPSAAAHLPQRLLHFSRSSGASHFFPRNACLLAGLCFFWKHPKNRDWRKKVRTRCCSVSSVFELVYSSFGALVCLTRA